MITYSLRNRTTRSHHSVGAFIELVEHLVDNEVFVRENTKMCLMKMNSCCCWFGLEVGVQIIGFFGILSAGAEMLFFIISALLMPLPQIKMISIYIVIGVLLACEFMCACVFTYGTFKKQAGFMLPWIGVAWLKGGVLLILFIIDVTKYAQTDAVTASAITLIVAYIAHALVLFYFACVSGSRRREIQLEDFSTYTSRLMRTDSTTHVYI